MSERFDNKSYPLFKRQADVQKRLAAGNLCLNWDMRLGKTRAALHAFERMTWEPDGPRNLLVVCPAIAKGVWEAEQYEMGLELPTVIHDGKTRLRSKGFAFNEVPQLTILNWEIADAWLERLTELMDQKKTVLVLDETHEHCTNPWNQRYKAVRDLAFSAHRVWTLTGTLYRTSALDIHHQLRLLGPAYPFYYTKANEFGDRFSYAHYNQFSRRNEYKGLRNEKDLMLACAPVIDRRRLLDEIPPNEVTWWLDEGDKWHYSSGDQPGEMAAARAVLSELKAVRTWELIRRNDLNSEPLVIFGWHHAFINKMAELTGGWVIDGSTTPFTRSEAIKAFNASSNGILVANIEAAGVAIDLAHARNAVFGEIDWVKATMLQAEARIRGPRQTRRTTLWYALALDSVDEFVWRTMLGRGRDMKRLDAAQPA